MNIRRCCLYLGMFATLPVSADAMSSFFLQANGELEGDFFATQRSINGPVSTLLPLSESLSATGSSPSGSSMSAASSGVADYGILRGFAATASTRPPGSSDLRAVAVSLANLSWADTFVFTGPSGTASIDARVTLMLDGTLSAACASDKSNCQAAAQINLHSSTQPALLPEIVLKEGNTDFTRLPPVTEDGVVSFTNGSTVQISSQLLVSSDAGPAFPGADTSSSDFMSTGRFFIDVLTPGASYNTASGHVYSAVPTAVPEPAGIALVLLGLGAIAGVSIRRKRNHLSTR